MSMLKPDPVVNWHIQSLIPYYHISVRFFPILLPSSMSDSKSSSSSVRNPFDTSNNSFMTHKHFNSELEYRYNNIKCRCDLLAPFQEAWREGTLDSGRRFFGCSQYKACIICVYFFWFSV